MAYSDRRSNGSGRIQYLLRSDTLHLRVSELKSYKPRKRGNRRKQISEPEYLYKNVGRKRYTQLGIYSIDGMDVVIGSTNPVKVTAVERALERFDPVVRPIEVDSGVSAQPRTLVETIEGAENRAHRAFDSAGFEKPEGFEKRRRARPTANGSFGVGIEGGVTRYKSIPGLYLIMWAAVTDGDRIERGGGPSLRLPDRLASRLDDGAELGPVIDYLLDRENVAETEGAAGVFTTGLTDRTNALEAAVSCAFGPFLGPEYDR